MWAPEWSEHRDPVSGARILQLTDYYCHSRAFYFTEPGWYAGGRKLAFLSQRENRTNLFGIDLASGEITQLTDLDPADGEMGNKHSMNPLKDELYFYQGDSLLALDLETLDLRTIHERPHGYVYGGTNVTADGKYVVTYHVQDLSDRFLVDLLHGYVGFREIWEARPHSMILRIATDGSGTEVIHEENYFLGHVNASPALADTITFCHEGPWNLVDHRIWGLNINSRKAWPIRPQQPGETVGHEYWMVDGEHVGYHGRTPGGPIYGAIRYDNTDRVEAPFTYGSTHFHSLSLDTIVGDGSKSDPYLLVWRFHEGQFEGPKVLAWHRGSFHHQDVHVHPRFSLDGRQVLYTADPQGYGQIFLAEVPEWDSLPDRAAVK